VRDVVCVHADRVIHAVIPRGLARFVEKYREWILVLFDVSLAPEQTVDFLGGNEENGRASLLKLVVS